MLESMDRLLEPESLPRHNRLQLSIVNDCSSRDEYEHMDRVCHIHKISRVIFVPRNQQLHRIHHNLHGNFNIILRGQPSDSQYDHCNGRRARIHQHNHCQCILDHICDFSRYGHRTIYSHTRRANHNMAKRNSTNNYTETFMYPSHALRVVPG
jgi:hypothetical protein